MKRMLRKAAFVQAVRYDADERRLAQYHGAIFADALRRRGVEATKTVVGDPAVDHPASPVLSVTSPAQRVSPDFWADQGYDLVVVYGGENTRNLPMLRAIKKGSPSTVVLLKMDAAYGPFRRTACEILRRARILYVKDRHGHSGRSGHDKSPPPLALLRSVGAAIRMLPQSYEARTAELFAVPDYVSYELPSALAQAQDWLRATGHAALADKVIWLGYPVRDAFGDAAGNVERVPQSIISVANWKHAKDLPLHAAALARVFASNPQAVCTLIGANSADLQARVAKLAPGSASRIRRIDEVANSDLPRHLQAARVFMLCSWTEGYCSAVVEALCAGCSTALSTGLAVPCFAEFVAHGCGTQAASRSPDDMAAAVLGELAAWREGRRSPEPIRTVWRKSLVSNLCKHLCETTGLELPPSTTRGATP